jgi:hypothetical protein
MAAVNIVIAREGCRRDVFYLRSALANKRSRQCMSRKANVWGNTVAQTVSFASKKRDLGETFPLQRARGPFLVQVTRYLRHCHIHLHTGSPLHSTNGNVPCAALRKRRFSTEYYAMMSLSCAGLPSASDLQLLQWLNR